ncbi:MAG: integration host factor subunit beta [Dechloromonas sp.]|uniref:integration host factor subunit beta n=1 Tax=Dechloromonas sp. TaxID=1917218 RepID=UPI0027E9AF7F|nr:integration host factor subunit beta [Dechloromonas sp.]MBT9519298.1 integration host factor subunit beta [Dechloromonas sp.]
MTRAELIFRLASRFPQLVLKDAELAVAETLAAFRQALVNNERIEIRGFGTFCLNYRASRSGRNPKTGASVAVTGKWTPHFKPGKALRDGVQPPSA